MRARLVSCLLFSAACGPDTDTTLSDSATAVTSATSGSTSDGQATGGLTSEGSTSGGSEGMSTGPMTMTMTMTMATSMTEAGTASSDPTFVTGTTEDPPATTGGAESTGAIDDCEELEAAFASEAMNIRSCVAADECGQELKGTSCGCTHNWVARLNADTEHFYALITMAERLGCELVPASTCDCPAAEGFACQNGICTWNYL